MTYNEWLIGLTYSTLVAVLMIASMFAIAWFVDDIINTWKSRKYVSEKSIHRMCVSEINNWCAYEFPQVGFVAQHILDVMDNKCGSSPSTIRETLRSGLHVREGSWKWAVKMMSAYRIVQREGHVVKYKLRNEGDGIVMIEASFNKGTNVDETSPWTISILDMDDFKANDWTLFDDPIYEAAKNTK